MTQCPRTASTECHKALSCGPLPVSHAQRRVPGAVPAGAHLHWVADVKPFAGDWEKTPRGNAVLEQHHTHTWLLLRYMLSSVNMSSQWIVSTTSETPTPAMKACSRLMEEMMAKL